jgi:hypothetical protein
MEVLMPLQATSGAASYDAFGGGVPFEPTYIEQIFSTFLYTGNGSTQTITNGIDLAGKGGLVWTKRRDASQSHGIWDTSRGANNQLFSDLTAGNNVVTDRLNSFNSSGFTVGSNASGPNISSATYASWTFRKQPKFFDVVTYTGNGVAGHTIAHNLGSVPGCIIVKKTSGVDNWGVYHRSIGNTKHLRLNTTDAEVAATLWNNTDPTATQFSVSGNYANESGFTYVAYLFAHDAGGFGLTGTDNVISCGSYTTDGSGNGTLQNIGYEPQWVMVKAATGTAEDWVINDSVRGMRANPSGSAQALFPNLASAESDLGLGVNISSNGFTGFGSASRTYIYIAIRRGPMKVPTDPTRVFRPNNYAANSGFNFTGTQSAPSVNPDLTIGTSNLASTRTDRFEVVDRLRGYGNTSTYGPGLMTNRTTSESVNTIIFQNNTGGTTSGSSISAQTKLYYSFKRAPGFMDVCCYTGTGSATTVAHNLAAVPELMIAKNRSTLGSFNEWIVYHSALGATKAVKLNETTAADTYSGYWNNTSPTATQFTLGAPYSSSGATYVAYLFATCPGVSKVGSYTGTGTTLQINCGFTAGSRFVMIKRTDSTGDWYVWDSARGIVSGNDPYLLLNSTAAEVTSTDYVDTYSAGFEISSTAPAAINASGGTFIFLAIA